MKTHHSKNKTKRQVKNFILKTLLPYKNNPKLCGYNGEGCEYLTEDGRKCAVGKWMKKGEWQNSSDNSDDLFEQYDKSEILLKPAIEMGFSDEVWSSIQGYHDTTASNSIYIIHNIKSLEKLLNIELTELKQ